MLTKRLSWPRQAEINFQGATGRSLLAVSLYHIMARQMSDFQSQDTVSIVDLGGALMTREDT